MAITASVLYGPTGEQYSTYSPEVGAANTGRWPLGTQLVLPDNRKFRFAYAGGSNLVMGTMQQQSAAIANHVLQTPTAASVGATSVSVALGATAAVVNQYKDGTLAIELGTGKGQAFGVAAHAAVSSSGTFVVPLAHGESVQVAIPATSNSVSLLSSPWYKVIQMPTTYTGMAVGVAMNTLTTLKFGWLQTRGSAAVLTNGTVVVGAFVVPSGTTAGAVEAASTTIATTVAQGIQVGFVQHVATSTNNSTIFLTIDS